MWNKILKKRRPKLCYDNFENLISHKLCDIMSAQIRRFFDCFISWPAAAFRGPPRPFMTLRGLSWPSAAFRGPPWPSAALRGWSAFDLCPPFSLQKVCLPRSSPTPYFDSWPPNPINVTFLYTKRLITSNLRNPKLTIHSSYTSSQTQVIRGHEPQLGPISYRL